MQDHTSQADWAPDKVEAKWNVNEYVADVGIKKGEDKVEAKWNVNVFRVHEVHQDTDPDKVEAKWNVNEAVHDRRHRP